MDWICQPDCGCFSRDLGDKIVAILLIFYYILLNWPSGEEVTRLSAKQLCAGSSPA